MQARTSLRFNLNAEVIGSRAFIVVLSVLLLNGCSGGDRGFYPLEDGRAWHYNITRTTMDGTFQQKHIVEALPEIEWGDSRGIPLVNAAGEQYLYQRLNGALQRVAVKPRTTRYFVAHDEPYTILPADIKPGTRWQQNMFSRVLENTGPPWETLFRIVEPVSVSFEVASVEAEVAVPAGQFKDCVKIVGKGEANVDVGNYIGRTIVSIEIVNWYAAGVGLVKSRRRETTTADALNYGEVLLELEHSTY
ncbi:MAG: hypothetical protein AAF387_08570 [Pseudomonadota bacterium]